MRTTSQRTTETLKALLIVIALTGVGFFLLLALGTYNTDQIGNASPKGQNLMGIIGAFFGWMLIVSYGLVAFLFPLGLFAAAIAILRGWRGELLMQRLSGFILLLPAICGLIHFFPTGWTGGRLLTSWGIHDQGFGGCVGWWLCDPKIGKNHLPEGILSDLLTPLGAALILLAILVAALFLLNLGLREYLKIVFQFFKTRFHTSSPGPLAPIARTSAPSTEGGGQKTIAEVSRRLATTAELVPPSANELLERIRARRRELSSAPEATPLAVLVQTPQDAPNPLPLAKDALPLVTKSEPLPEPEPQKPQEANAAKAPAEDAPPHEPRYGYVLPATNLLDVAKQRHDSLHDAEIKETARVIEATFREFAIDVRCVHSTRGPVITQYEFELLNQGMRVGRLEGYEKDLSLKLGTGGIRIVAPLPDRKTVGVEVPNKTKEAVTMRDIIEEIDPEKFQIPLIIGRDAIGRPMVDDLAKMPHLLVAGATGMGKSVCMNALITSILLFRDPNEVKLILVDPKQVELSGYDGIPHLLTPPITDMTKAHMALEWACKVMDERYHILRMTGVRSIADFNKLGERELRRRLAEKNVEPDDIPQFAFRLHYIVIIVDEYADLMMVNKEVEKSIVRLAAKSRACGIHVILTTQRPSADVVTGLIKSNLPTRVAFRVTDKSNSRVVLDQGGAENLLGRGDMLYLPPGSSTLVRGQGVWVKDQEIEAVIRHARSQGKPVYDDSIFKIGAVAMEGGGESGEDVASDWVSDKQMHEAVYWIYKTNKTGADFLRRRVNLGYNRATGIIEALEDLGFLGPQKGAKRDILKKWDDWMALLEENGVDVSGGEEYYRNPFED